MISQSANNNLGFVKFYLKKEFIYLEIKILDLQL